MHFHILKQESWYVNKGKFLFNWIDTQTAEKKSCEMNIGDSVTIEVGLPHQLIALEDGEIFEVSTQHFDTDSYRVEKGTSQV
jgi:mannose-6-phosphate isomerase-like protein (cupin superfamily)